MNLKRNDSGVPAAFLNSQTKLMGKVNASGGMTAIILFTFPGSFFIHLWIDFYQTSFHLYQGLSLPI